MEGSTTRVGSARREEWVMCSCNLCKWQKKRRRRIALEHIKQHDEFDRQLFDDARRHGTVTNVDISPHISVERPQTKRIIQHTAEKRLRIEQAETPLEIHDDPMDDMIETLVTNTMPSNTKSDHVSRAHAEDPKEQFIKNACKEPLYAGAKVSTPFDSMLLTLTPFGETRLTHFFFCINASRYTCQTLSSFFFFSIFGISNVAVNVLKQVVFYPARPNPRWWYVIQTAPCSRHIFDERGVEEFLPGEAMEEDHQTDEEHRTIAPPRELCRAIDETSSDDSSNEGDNDLSNGNNDDPFNSLDMNDMVPAQSVTSTSLGINLELVLNLSRMPKFNPGDVVDLLDGGEVVAKGRVVNVDPHSYVHGMPMPAGHVSVSVVRYVNGTVYISFPPPHDPESCRLADVLGTIIAWPRVALALENTVPTRSHSRQSHSRTSSQSSRGSKYSSMSEDNFEAEAARRGFERKKKGSSSEATLAGCFGDCFGLGSKEKPSPALETVIEDETDDNFEFRPHTQLQVNEPNQ
ncbi:hypothetical protein L7F22_005297 [Adiantum nelumboides]|nr:hypothetical protein [Adiantum nelumboides]